MECEKDKRVIVYKDAITMKDHGIRAGNGGS